MNQHQDLVRLSTSEAFSRIKCAIFVPEAFLLCISEHPDFICPFWIGMTFGLLAAILQWKGNILNTIRFFLRIYLVLFCYVVWLPILIGFFYRRIRGHSETFVVRYTILLICCLGYSLIFGCLFCSFVLGCYSIGILEEIQGILVLIAISKMGAFLWKCIGMLNFSTFPVADADSNMGLACFCTLIAFALSIWFLSVIF